MYPNPLMYPINKFRYTPTEGTTAVGRGPTRAQFSLILQPNPKKKKNNLNFILKVLVYHMHYLL